jgi:hypothetical protein
MNTIYHSYLLRIWTSDSVDDSSWRASLEDPHNRKITTYHDPEALFCFLREISDPSKCNNVSQSNTKEGNEK